VTFVIFITGLYRYICHLIIFNYFNIDQIYNDYLNPNISFNLVVGIAITFVAKMFNSWYSTFKNVLSNILAKFRDKENRRNINYKEWFRL
jgi:hypothetical protein